MKQLKVFGGIVIVLVSVLVLSGLVLGHGNDRGHSQITLDGGRISVEYGRPELKGRDVNTLIEPGQTWRMGSDAATTLTTDIPLAFADKVLPKGSYILVAKLIEKGKWHLLVMSKKIESKPAQTLIEYPMTVTELSKPVELVTIDLENKGKAGKLNVMWGTLKASAEFRSAKKS
jgi:hypothetical protein